MLDIVGTGGDRSMSVNISTMAAIVAASAGVPVVKHGSRSASSTSGSADVLEALGVRLDRHTTVARVGEEAGITFCFAAAFPALRRAAAAPRARGRHHVQLPRPAGPPGQARGAGDRLPDLAMAPVMARSSPTAASTRVFRGDDGLDELTTTTTSRSGRCPAARSRRHARPADLGIPRGTAEGLRGRDAAYNADVVRRVVAGEHGQVRDAVVLNAGAALAVRAAEPGTLLERLAAGIARANESIDSGAPGGPRPVGRVSASQ